MDTKLKYSKLRRNFSLVIVIFGILSGFSFPGILNAPRAEADFLQISLPEDLKGVVIIEGNSLLPITEPVNPESQSIRIIQGLVTGYSSTEDQTDSDPFVTAAGTWVREGIVANSRETKYQSGNLLFPHSFYLQRQKFDLQIIPGI
jgi:hypothetical protein